MSDIFTSPPKTPPANQEEANDRFLQHFDRAQEIAAAVNGPTKVKAFARKQTGVDILVAQCPCGSIAGLTGEGMHLCRHCHRWLQYVREA
jgi:hypothetical protein